MSKNIAIIVFLFLLIFHNQTLNAQVLLKETAWLQTNRDVYLAGEEIFFKVNLLENDTYHSSVLSKNIRIELIDGNGNSFVRKNIQLENSENSDRILLPVNLKTEKYYLRAYSNWMRNFSEDDFSELEIRVLNVEDANQDSLLQKNNHVNINIYPYSDPNNPGQLKCGIFSADKFGEGMKSKGLVLNNQGDTVLVFHCDKTGWASSDYRPSDIKQYQVFVNGFQKENISFEVKMVHNRNEQISSSVTKENGYLNVAIKGVQTGANYKLLLHRTYSWSWFQTNVAENNSIAFHIPLKDIPVGLSQIAVLDEGNKIIFKQLWADYDQNVSVIKIEMDTSNITTDSYQEYSYDSCTAFSMNETGNLQLLADKFLPETTMQLYLPGLPGWHANYEIPADKSSFEGWINANLYPDKVTHSFFISDTKFPTPPDWKNNQNFIEHYPETRGGILSGKIFNEKTGEALSLVSVALTVLNDNSFYAAQTDTNGRFVFAFPDQNFSKDYVLNYVNRHDSLWQLDITPDYEPSKPEKKNHKAFFTAEELEFLKSQNLTIQLRNLYSAKTASIQPDNADTVKTNEMFYGKPEIAVQVEDYIHLPNVRELIFEVVPNVTIRQQNGKYILGVTGKNLYASNYPTLILFDGIPIYDYQKLLTLPPERILSIEAKTNFYIHGNTIFGGIINIRSVNNDLAGLNLPETAILSKLYLPEKVENKSVRAQKSESEGMPNLDDILVWENLKNASKGTNKIYCNNNPGKYILSIYGYGEDGKWNSGKLIIDVH